VLQRLSQRRDEKRASSSRVQRRITSAQFDPSGRIAVVGRSAEDDKLASVQVWNVDHLAGSQTQMLTGANASFQPSTSTRQDQPEQTLQLPEMLGTAEVVLPLDSRTMLTMNNNAAFKWDLSTKKLIKSYRAHSQLTEACFSFDGQFVATGSRSVKIWNANTGEALAKLESPHVGPVRSVQFAPQAIGATGYVLATGGDDGTASLWQWDSKTRKFTKLKQRSFVGTEGADKRVVRRVRFSPGSDRLLVVGDGGLAQLWDLRRSTTMTLPGANDDQGFVCGGFSPDGKCVAAGSTDHTVRIWELPNVGGEPELPIVMSGHSDTVNDVAMLGKNKTELRLMTASSDGTARVWDPRLNERDDQGKHPRAREVISLRRHTGNVNSIDITGDGGLMMTTGSDGMVILWPAAATPVEPQRKNLFDAL
jgi:WD40 repeat protein